MRKTKTTKPTTPLESAILKSILEALRYRKDVVAWRSNTGAAKLIGKGGKPRPVFFGEPGQADITGMIKPKGVRLEIEVKRPGKKQSVLQVAFEQRVRDAGGVYILTTSASDCMAQLDAAIFLANLGGAR